MIGGISSSAQSPSDSPFATEFKGFIENFNPNTRAAAYGQQSIYPPEEAVRMLDTPEGYRVNSPRTEPQIRQPIDIHFDHRGRLWVVHIFSIHFPRG